MSAGKKLHLCTNWLDPRRLKPSLSRVLKDVTTDEIIYLVPFLGAHPTANLSRFHVPLLSTY